MRLFRLWFFVVVVSISGVVLASPATGVSGPENLSYTCRIQQPSACPSRRSCSGCPECEVCESPSASTSASGSPSSSASASPPEVQCKYYSFDFSHRAVSNAFKIDIDGTGAKKLNCFENLVNQAITAMNALPNRTNLGRLGRYDNDREYVKSRSGEATHGTGNVFASFLWAVLKINNGLVGGIENIAGDWAKVQSDNRKAQAFITCNGGYSGVGRDKPEVYARYQIGGAIDFNENNDSVDQGRGCNRGEMHFDEECKFVSVANVARAKREGADLCGKISTDIELSTPVSLVWSEAYSDTPSTLVSFKLNPYSDQKAWLWKGSESLPLLVYDPEHTGVINSATQLFGSWTFGGNGLASLLEGHSQGTAWRDGYEALSKMDKDLDGKVSGVELEDLALWFDKNQDGISQQGEVKSLSDVSVTTLYYKADKKQDSSLIASKGYARELNGKTVIASSIDWSERSLKDDLSLMLENMGVSAHSKISQSTTDKPLSDTSENSKEVVDAVAGVWSWNLDVPARGSGLLAFDSTDEGMQGASLTQFQVEGVSGVNSEVLFSHFAGSVGKNVGDQVEVKFTTEGENGVILNNIASLSKDGTQLVGKTVVTGSSLAESGTYEYSWKAERIK